MATLDDVSDSIVDGPFGSSLKTSDYVDTGVPVLQGKNITGDSFVWKEVRYISDRKAQELNRSSVIPGDHLMIKIGSIGYSAIVDHLNGNEFAIIPANLARIRPDRSVIDDRYLHQWLKSEPTKRHFQSVASSTAQPALSLSKIRDATLPVPPLDEQRRIAAILDKADALRQKRKCAIFLLDSLTQSIFARLMDQASTTSTLGDLTTEIYRYPTYYGITYEDSGVPEIRGELIMEDGSINDDPSKLRFISKETSARFPKTVLAAGDLVMSVRGTIGKVGRISCQLAGSNMTANLVRLAPDRRKIDDLYLWEVMRSQRIKALMAKASSSTTIATIKSDDLRSLPIPMPDREAQVEYARGRVFFDAVLERARRALFNSETLFASLQHRAFSGQL